jgi:hypothetical protein
VPTIAPASLPSPTTTLAGTTAPTTTVAATTTAAPTTTVTPTTTTALPPTTPAPTTTTPPVDLTLRPDALGPMALGVEAEAAIQYLTAILGPAATDTGWVEAFSSPFGVCPGNEVRGLEWGPLLVIFGDGTGAPGAARTFLAYTYGLSDGVVQGSGPGGLRTLQGLSVGATVAELKSLHPGTEVFDEDVLGASYLTPDGMYGILSDVSDGGIVVTIHAGTTCGE